VVLLLGAALALSQPASQGLLVTGWLGGTGAGVGTAASWLLDWHVAANLLAATHPPSHLSAATQLPLPMNMPA